MHDNSLPSRLFRVLTVVAAYVGLLIIEFISPSAHAQMTQGADVNVSLKAKYQNTCAIIANPSNKNQLFAACQSAGRPGLFAARSTDRGVTWAYTDPADGTIADGTPGQGPAACCLPTLAWDTLGNLYLAYLGNFFARVVVLRSTDAGVTFTTFVRFTGSVDYPTVKAADTTAGVRVWVVWNQSNLMRARGAVVTGLGTAGGFFPLQTIPGTINCALGDFAISPAGVVVQACQNPTAGEGPATILVNIDADGLGPGGFGAPIAATTTNVGGIDFIPAMDVGSIDADVGLAYDRNPCSPRFGRLYLVYTEEPINENDDTDIMLRFSDDDGASWSGPPIRVNEDPAVPIRSQFLPRIATNPISGNIAVCWHDARNSAANNTMQVFCEIETPAPATPAFLTLANIQVSDALSPRTGSSPPPLGEGDSQFGNYSGLTYFRGFVHPIWADASNSTGDNPDGALALVTFEAYTDRVTGGAAANEGDPHMQTLDGTRYDFQSAGEFVSLLGDGLEIQIRQTAIATTFFPGANAHTGLATCVSLNTAVAAQVGAQRVSYQPGLSGVPDPNDLQLRVDGTLVRLPASGLDLSDGGRIVKSAIGDGIEIAFPNGTTLIVTPGFWSSQSKWYLNVNAYNTTATGGTMGVIAQGSWLPALPDGTSLGPIPPALPDRYTTLNQTFANAWRVTDSSSLFDYAPGTATADFTISSWPLENPPCVLLEMPQVAPLDLAPAQTACALITDAGRNANCVFDVQVTGEVGFADTYLLTQQLENGASGTTVTDNIDPSQLGEDVRFTAMVVRTASARDANTPTGTVQFTLDGTDIGSAVTLDSNGRAELSISTLALGDHKVAASYTPTAGSVFLASSSGGESHTVAGQQQTREQQKCINTLNKNFAKVAGAQSRGNCSCIRDASVGRLSGTIEDCLTADRRGVVARKQTRAVLSAAKQCTSPASFGPDDAAVANTAAVEKEIDLIHDIFGLSLDGGVIVERAVNRDTAKCQQAIARTTKRCQDTHLREFNRCKRTGLRLGTVISGFTLEQCLGADSSDRILRSCDASLGKIRREIDRRCVSRSADLSDAFPGCGTDDPATLAACLEASVACRTCEALNAVDNLARDCDEFDDGVVNGSCP